MSTAGLSTNVGTTAADVGTFTALLLDVNPTYSPSGYPLVRTPFEVTIGGLGTPGVFSSATFGLTLYGP